MTTGWRLEQTTGRADDFHQRPLEPPLERTLSVFAVDRPALVLGSTQPRSVADATACAAAGVDVVKRRSGGGAVLLDPGEAVWVDVDLPRGDPLWDDDVGRAAWWLGDAWAAALPAVGLHGHVHRGALVRSDWSDLVCFAGLGPGEVIVDGAKVVGLSQRRTRAGARFQCAVALAWRPDRLASLLALDAATRARLATDLAGAVRTVRPDAPLVDALVDILPA